MILYLAVTLWLNLAIDFWLLPESAYTTNW